MRQLSCEDHCSIRCITACLESCLCTNTKGGAGGVCTYVCTHWKQFPWIACQYCISLLATYFMKERVVQFYNILSVVMIVKENMSGSILMTKYKVWLGEMRYWCSIVLRLHQTTVLFSRVENESTMQSSEISSLNWQNKWHFCFPNFFFANGKLSSHVGSLRTYVCDMKWRDNLGGQIARLNWLF